MKTVLFPERYVLWLNMLFVGLLLLSCVFHCHASPSMPWEAAINAPLQWGGEEESNSRTATNESRSRNIDNVRPSSSQQYRRPIHYNFPRSSGVEGDQREPSRTSIEKDATPSFASPRSNDPVVRLQSTLSGRVAIPLVSAGVGAISATTLVGGYARIGAMILLLVTLLGRGLVGDWVRSLSVAVLLTLHRSYRVLRREYPSHMPVLLGVRARRKFPPVEGNGFWQYQPEAKEDPEFTMLWSTVALAITSGMCGYHCSPIKWIGGWAAAGLAAFLISQDSASGDVARTAGMRLVATSRVFRSVAGDLDLLPQTGRVVSTMIDRLLVFDRQHKVKDRLVALMSAVASRVSKDEDPANQFQTSDLERMDQNSVSRGSSSWPTRPRIATSEVDRGSWWKRRRKGKDHFPVTEEESDSDLQQRVDSQSREDSSTNARWPRTGVHHEISMQSDSADDINNFLRPPSPERHIPPPPPASDHN